MKYYKVQFNGDINVQGYQVVDDRMSNVLGYINLDGTDIDLNDKQYSCNVLDVTILSEEDILPGTLWHESGCTIRVKMRFENNLTMLQNYPELGVYIKQSGINSFVEQGYTYIYVNYLLPEHRALLEAFGATIIEK